jgi:hypothetical protein
MPAVEKCGMLFSATSLVHCTVAAAVAACVTGAVCSYVPSIQHDVTLLAEPEQPALPQALQTGLLQRMWQATHWYLPHGHNCVSVSATTQGSYMPAFRVESMQNKHHSNSSQDVALRSVNEISCVKCGAAATVSVSR